MVFGVVFLVVTGILAMRKGYNFFAWVLAGGCIGLVVLAFLPFANSEKLPPEQRAVAVKRGNTIGLVVSACCVVLGFVALASR